MSKKNPEISYTIKPEIFELIGKGAFNSVYKGKAIKYIDKQIKNTDETIALKEIPKKLDDETRHSIENEILVSSKLSNVYIVRMVGLIDINQRSFIAYEYCNGGDLRKYMDYFQTFDEGLIQTIMNHIVNGLSELFLKDVVHHDIKPENILLKLFFDEDNLSPDSKGKYEAIMNILNSKKNNDEQDIDKNFVNNNDNTQFQYIDNNNNQNNINNNMYPNNMNNNPNMNDNTNNYLNNNMYNNMNMNNNMYNNNYLMNDNNNYQNQNFQNGFCPSNNYNNTNNNYNNNFINQNNFYMNNNMNNNNNLNNNNNNYINNNNCMNNMYYLNDNNMNNNNNMNNDNNMNNNNMNNNNYMNNNNNININININNNMNNNNMNNNNYMNNNNINNNNNNIMNNNNNINNINSMNKINNVTNNNINNNTNTFQSLNQLQILKEIDFINILKNSTEYKLSDFGLSKLKNDIKKRNLCGSPLYMSPELFKIDSNIADIENRKLDIWALGILAYELFFGKRPFEAFSLDELSQMFEKGNYQIDLSLTKEEKISKEFFIFLTKCLQKDPINRANILELKNSDFLNLNIDYLEKMNSIEFENFLQDSSKIKKENDKTIFIININKDYSNILGITKNEN